MKHVPVITGIALTVLAACSSNLNPNPIATPSQRMVGLLEVTVSGIGDGGTPTSSARFIDPSGPQSGLGTKAAIVVPVNGLNAANDIEFKSASVGVFDDDATTTRYVSNTFELINRKEDSGNGNISQFDNLTLYAVNTSSNLGGSGIATLKTVAGATVANAAVVARSFQPLHAMRQTGLGLEVNPNNADLQLFTPREVNNTAPSDLGVQQQAIAAGILAAGSTVLEYGFVARGQAGGRFIDDIGQSLDCLSPSCKGFVTLSYKFPRLTPRSSNPWSFTLRFVVAEQTDTMYSQSLEEQSAGTVAGLAAGAVGSAYQVRTLLGSTYSGSNQNSLCRVRTALAVTSTFPTAVTLPIQTSVPSSGSVDVCFGTNGQLLTTVGPVGSYATALGIDSNDNIFAAGTSPDVSNTDFAVAKYNRNGNLDTSFDLDGKVTTTFTNTSVDRAYALGIQSDGKIVVAGESDNNFALVRYNTNGSLDNTFDFDGKVTTTFTNTSIDRAYALGIQGDGKIVIAGESDGKFALVRYNTNGSLDSTFGTNGGVITAVSSNYNIAKSLRIQADGKIVVAGPSSPNGLVFHFALVRYNTNGSPDTTFGTNGVVITDFGSGQNIARTVGIQADNKIVVGGFTTNATSNQDLALARYNTNGTLDTSFDGDGKVITMLSSRYDTVSALVIRADGKIVIAGESYDLNIASQRINSNAALARYNTNGSLDTSFDGDGTVSHTNVLMNYVFALGLQSDGKIVIAGENSTSPSKFALARFNP
jgi:uncharacterized delta-60 repeat protein